MDSHGVKLTAEGLQRPALPPHTHRQKNGSENFPEHQKLSGETEIGGLIFPKLLRGTASLIPIHLYAKLGV